MARIFKRGDIYFAWVPKPEGGTRKVTTNCTDKEAAHARAVELERIAVDPERAAAAKATLREALELLIRERLSAAQAKKRTKSMATVEFYQAKSGVLIDGIAAVLRRSPKAIVYLREVNAALVDDYIIQRREDGVLDTTIAKELTTWRTAMRLAKRRSLWFGDLEQVFPKGFGGDYSPGERYVTPAELVKLFRAMVRPTEHRKHGLSDKQLAVLRERFDAGDNRIALAKSLKISTATLWKLGTQREEPKELPVRGHEFFAIVAYVIATGAEPSAVWRAKRTDPADDCSRCMVWGSKNKYREGRDVPLPLLAFRMLLDYAVTHADGDHFLFPQRHASAFRRTLGEACERAGIARVSLTDLRRTHGKWLRLSGVAPSAIAPSLGHADGRMAERVYGKATAAELRHVVEAQIAAGGGGLLMGGDSGDSGDSPVVLGESESSLLPGNAGAQRRNRTADTGIFNPFRSTENVAQDANPRTKWEANGHSLPGSSTDSWEAEADGGVSSDPPPDITTSHVLEGKIAKVDLRLRMTSDGATFTALSDSTPTLDGHEVELSNMPLLPTAPEVAKGDIVGPGPARARPPLEVDGRVVLEDEELSDVAAVFPLARGGR